MAHPVNHQAVGNKPDDNRRNTVQQIGYVPDDKRKRLAAIFGEINSSEKSDRNPNQRRQQQNLSAAHDGVGHSSAGLTDGRRQLREEGPAQRCPAVIDQISQNEEQDSGSHHRAQTGDADHEQVHRILPPGRASHDRTPRLLVARIRRRAMPFRTKVTPNKPRPRSTKALGYKSPVPSVNSLAITAAMEYPGASSDALICGVFPITMVTAIVSPS